MTTQTKHGKYPVKGIEVHYDRFYSITCNLISGFVPLASLVLLNYFQFGALTQMLTLPLIYLIFSARWTLGYHKLLHEEEELNPVLDVLLGAGLGHLLTFKVGREIHNLHHNYSYCENSRELSLDTTQDYLTEEDIAYRMNEILKLDPDYWFKSSPNRWVLFCRCFVFDLHYIDTYLKKKSEEKWSYSKYYFSRLVLIFAPLWIVNPLAYLLHLIICRVLMAVTFMLFSTLAHEKDWFDSMVDQYYPFQEKIDVNLFLEILFGYHVHHVNEHDNHHLFPKRDVSMLAETSIPRRIFNFIASKDCFNICFDKFENFSSMLKKQPKLTCSLPQPEDVIL